MYAESDLIVCVAMVSRGEKQRLNRSLNDLLQIAKNNGQNELLRALSSIPVSRQKPILDEADQRALRHSN